TAVSHTANAELIYGGFTPTYDNADNRREDKTTGGAATAPQYYMTYNHKNERTVRGYAANGSVWKTNAVQFVYDENSHLIGEYNADGVPLVEYVWLGDKPVAAIYGSGTTAKTYWIATDTQNTPRRLIDAADGTTTVWAWDSTAFGVGLPGVQTVKFNLRFPGQYYDEVTKQHYNHNRFYNPVLGRYMEPDRIGLEGGLNPYIYTKGDPVNSVDPSGLDCVDGSCGTKFEQALYDWWPGYKFGTGLYNSLESGSNQYNFWEGVDLLSVFGGVGAKSLQFADNAALSISSKVKFISPTRPLGSKLEYIDDVFANPKLLRNVKSPDHFKSLTYIDNNYVEGVMKRTRSLDKGFTLRELAPDGKNVTDRYIQYHPGSVRHYNGQPYWKISSGKNGTVRFPVE
ncbi:RHS repeat-associated core domain-containing protein, partial [Acinetobacter baumannii]|nr:RHS repeat-associated core domain-containing protein [Acinetobacter baumannii]